MANVPPEPRARRVLLNGLAGVGPVTVRRLVEAFGPDLSRALESSPERLRQVRGVSAAAARSIAAGAFDWRREMEESARRGFRIVTPDDDGWPAELSRLWDPPLLLYAEGPSLPDGRAVAVIGSRRCTPYGAALARTFARDLAKAGWWVVSGLARGVDAAAHEGALEAGGRTAAVLGHGLDLTYPPEAADLRRRMAVQGCVLSEFPLGRPADRQSFPQRNRIVAGLARAVVVIETDVDGGSMITARFAADLGRTVCAVPGRADSPSSRGCHALIRDGAVLVSSAAEVLEELGERGIQPELTLPEEPPEHARWLRHFGGGTAHDADSLAEAARCPTPEAAVMLTLLEIRGVLRRRPDGRHERA